MYLYPRKARKICSKSITISNRLNKMAECNINTLKKMQVYLSAMTTDNIWERTHFIL